MFKVNQCFKRGRLVLAQGPNYITTYGRWRALRLARQIGEGFVKPGWDYERLLKIMSSTVGAQLVSSSVELGPALQNHFVHRAAPTSHLSRARVGEIIQRVPANRKAKTLALAEKIMRGQFSYRGVTVTFDQEIDWQHRPNSNIDWTWDLNRHYCLTALARAYAYTEDERFAVHAVTLLKSWMAQNPPRVGSPVWRPFEVSTRLNAWLWTFFLLLKSDYFAWHGLTDMLTGIAVQAQFLLENLEYHVESNHLLLEAKTLAMMGLFFPEFKDASKWQQVGLNVVWQQFEAQVCADGVHAERSIHYHMLVGSEMWELIHVLDGNDLPMPAMVKPRFAKMVDFARTIVKPDQTIPLFGDAARTDEHIRFDVRWAGQGMPIDDEMPGEETFWLLNEETSSTAGQYAPKSAGFPQGGYYVMREDSAGSVSYLAFDCGPFGHTPVPSHGHADALSFELFAFGETLITDCGSFRYHAPAPWRNYFRGTRAHNTLMIDGQDQSVLVGVRQVERPAMATTHRWIASTDLDLIEGSHDGYMRLTEPVTHRRKILFVKPDYWLVLDEVQGSGEHQLDWFYHLMPRAQTSLDVASGELRCQLGQAGLVIRPFWLDGVEARLIAGDEATYQGWVSLESGQKEAAPVLNYRRQGDVPVRFGTLLYPHPVDKQPGVTLHLLDTKPNILGLRLQVGARDDSILLTDGGEVGHLSYGDWQVKASLLIVRQLTGGKYRLILADATFVCWQGRTVFEAAEIVSNLSMTCELAQDVYEIKLGDAQSGATTGRH